MEDETTIVIPASLLLAIRDWFVDNDFCEEDEPLQIVERIDEELAKAQIEVSYIFEDEYKKAVIHVCVRCGRTSSITWWKCCTKHCTEQGPDVICQSCVEQMHPNEEEFFNERG